MSQQRFDQWAKKVTSREGDLSYDRKRGSQAVNLLSMPGKDAWSKFTVPTSMREVEPGVNLLLNNEKLPDGPDWKMPSSKTKENES